jgi:8-oxo-dGTP pyrophosphatase MutT (NUDIX family)
MRYTPRAILYKLLYRLLRFYWFVFRPQVRGTRCLVECEGKWLLIRQTYGDMKWTLPGGLIGKGETSEEAARREVREEVGLDLVWVRSIGVYTNTAAYARDTVHCFRGASSGSELQLDRDEVYEAAWFELDELPAEQSPQLRVVLDLYAGEAN